MSKDMKDYIRFKYLYFLISMLMITSGLISLCLFGLKFSIGPTLSREFLIKTVLGVLVAAGVTFFYVTWCFKSKMYGLGTTLGIFQNTLVLLGSFSLLGHFLNVEVDTLLVTAVLAALSFSVYDTVVVFGGIKETGQQYPGKSFEGVVNLAINKTITRSLNNSLTMTFILLSLLLLSGPDIRWFLVTLLIGTVVGTYSSVFVVAPLLAFFQKWRQAVS